MDTLQKPAKWSGPQGERWTDQKFLAIDQLAVWFYVACILCFVVAVAANLNGSSADMFHDGLGVGAKQTPLLGKARNIRSDEWAYSTPDVLNQVLRVDRFAVESTAFGNYSVGLTGNIPTKHFTILLRPQFWGFFVLPVEYGYSFFWQAKGLLLVVGVFTWLLLLTGSSFWSLTGTLWFYFSACTQWSYSWPSGLPEMIGTGCLATVCFCYLATGTRLIPCLMAGLGAVMFSVDFVMGAYVPHLVPLACLNISVLAGWYLAKRQQVFQEEGRWLRLGVWLAVMAAIAGAGIAIFLDLKVAIAAISATQYPGKRIISGGSLPYWKFGMDFIAWHMSEMPYPGIMNNICEGSGYIWLAPVAILTLTWKRLSRTDRLLFVAISAIGGILLLWVLVPIPSQLGGLLLLNRSGYSRVLPALGLANVALVCLCLARQREAIGLLRRDPTRRQWLCFGVLTAVCFGLFYAADSKTAHFVSNRYVLLGSVLAAAAATLILSARHRALALLLIGSHALAFGLVNPVQRGLNTFLGSELYQFVHQDPAYTRERWAIYTDSPMLSGFFAAIGCETLTGTHYLPDIDHFALFQQRGLDFRLVNRLGYLTLKPAASPPAQALKLIDPSNVQWSVAPDDPILREMGVRYAAFRGKPDGAIVSQLKPLADHAIDGFWLYELPPVRTATR